MPMWMQPIFDNLAYLLSTRGSHLEQAESKTTEQHIDKLIDGGKLVLEPPTRMIPALRRGELDRFMKDRDLERHAVGQIGFYIAKRR